MARLSDRVRALVQPHLADIEPYDPNFTPCRINLSANENTYPVPDGVRERVDAALASTPLNRYPDPMSHALRAEIAARHGVAPACVCVGNGGDELLYNFLLAFGGRASQLLVCPPCFSEYEFFASLTQTPVCRAGRDPRTFELDEEAVLASAHWSKLAVVTSPNNPTGGLVPLPFVERLCHVCRGLVMVDEAYIEFAGEDASATRLLDRHPNLVVLRTLSKAFGAAGIRCGYVLAAPDVIEAFAAVRQIYSVNVLSQAAALALVESRAEFAPVVGRIVAERERMFAALSADPRVKVWPSRANFLLVRMPMASRIRERLRDEYSMLVRDFSYAPGLEGCLRITVGTPEENDEVLAALSALLDEEA